MRPRAFVIMASARACWPVPSSASSKIAWQPLGRHDGGLSGSTHPRRRSRITIRATAWPATRRGLSAAFRSRRGQMFFGSTSGLTSFWPDQIVERRTIPPVVLTEFSLRNVPVSPAPGSVLAKSITDTPSLTLSHDQNMFSFEFAALSYVDPQRNQYRYMLEPLDVRGIRVDSQRRTATYDVARRGLHAARSGLEQSWGME